MNENIHKYQPQKSYVETCDDKFTAESRALMELIHNSHTQTLWKMHYCINIQLQAGFVLDTHLYSFMIGKYKNKHVLH